MRKVYPYNDCAGDFFSTAYWKGAAWPFRLDVVHVDVGLPRRSSLGMGWVTLALFVPGNPGTQLRSRDLRQSRLLRLLAGTSSDGCFLLRTPRAGSPPVLTSLLLGPFWT